MMFWYGHHMSGWGWFGASFGMIVFWGLGIAAFVLFLRALDRSQPSGPRAPWAPPTSASPEQLLAERFARGEIDEEEYRRRLQVLRTEDTDLTKH